MTYAEQGSRRSALHTYLRAHKGEILCTADIAHGAGMTIRETGHLLRYMVFPDIEVVSHTRHTKCAWEIR